MGRSGRLVSSWRFDAFWGSEASLARIVLQRAFVQHVPISPRSRRLPPPPSQTPHCGTVGAPGRNANVGQLRSCFWAPGRLQAILPRSDGELQADRKERWDFGRRRPGNRNRILPLRPSLELRCRCRHRSSARLRGERRLFLFVMLKDSLLEGARSLLASTKLRRHGCPGASVRRGGVHPEG